MPETVVHFQIRMAPGIHERLTSWAKDERASLNALVVKLLDEAIASHEAGSSAAEKGAKASAATH